MKKKAIGLIMTLGLILSIVAGCGSGSSTELTDKHLVWGETQAVSSLDPAIDWQGWFTVRYAISETLFKLDDQLVPQPWLAEAYQNIDPDTWEITIKDGITFSNGTLLTADMVVENLKRVGSINKRASVLGEANYTVDGNVLTIKTASPFPTLINELCDPYASILDLEGTDDFDQAPIGTGPYQVADMVEEIKIDLTANDDYWDGEPKIKTAQVKFVTDTDTLAMALQSGEVDVAVNLTSDSRENFEANPDYKIEEVATSRAYFMYYNLLTVTDPALRQAIAMAIDKEGMAEFLFEGSVTPAVGAFPNNLAYGGDQLKGSTFNVDEAKNVLSGAGYLDTDGDGILEKDGGPLSLRIVTYERLKNEAIVTELQSELKAIGIATDVTVHDNSDFFKAGEFDIGIYSIVTTAVGDPQAFLNNTLGTDGVTNFGSYKNPETDERLLDLKAEFDSKKRAQLAIEIQQTALDEFAFDNIGFVNMMMIMDSNITGLKPHPSDYYQMNATMNME